VTTHCAIVDNSPLKSSRSDSFSKFFSSFLSPVSSCLLVPYISLSHSQFLSICTIFCSQGIVHEWHLIQVVWEKLVDAQLAHSRTLDATFDGGQWFYDKNVYYVSYVTNIYMTQEKYAADTICALHARLWQRTLLSCFFGTCLVSWAISLVRTSWAIWYAWRLARGVASLPQPHGVILEERLLPCHV